jgi:signal transduction histidine kinase
MLLKELPVDSGVDSVRLPSPWSEILEKEREAAVSAQQQRLANEFHDLVDNHLSCVSLLLAAARLNLREGDEKNLLRLAEQGIGDCRRDLRRRTAGFGARTLNGRDLVTVLSLYASDCTAIFGIPVLFSCTGTTRSLWENVRVAIFRITQEATSNALCRARPTAVSIELTFAEEGVGLKISDNGIGVDVARASSELAFRKMQNHAAAIGAELAILKPADQGTQVVMTISR